MWISQCGADCCEGLISIFSLSNTGSEGRGRLCTPARFTAPEQWQLVCRRLSVAQKASHADTFVWGHCDAQTCFLFNVIYRKKRLFFYSQTKGRFYFCFRYCHEFHHKRVKTIKTKKEKASIVVGQTRGVWRSIVKVYCEGLLWNVGWYADLTS